MKTGRLSRYGMVWVLLLLAALFSVLTLKPQNPGGAAAARRLAPKLTDPSPTAGAVLVVGRAGPQDREFVDRLVTRLQTAGVTVAGQVTGSPAEIRRALTGALAGDLGAKPDRVATVVAVAPTVRAILADLPGGDAVTVVTPEPRLWPTFLLPKNLRNIAGQIAVIAILAVGMTMVIITGGIDLSVGSLIALAAVVGAWSVGRLGGASASIGAMLLGGAAAAALCAACGAFSGLMVTRFKLPPFIATLAMMQVASGLAYIFSQGKPFYDLPQAFVTLGRGTDPLLAIPWSVWLMLVLYLGAHLLMSRTVLGRHIYAVGGNAEAARLAGVRVPMVLMFVYTLSGVLAGVGGVVMASQLKSGAPTYGLMYELYVIAAVVVGGTSLAGGEGRIFGTLIGAFIIAVIQNGMNLTNVESYTQKVVLGGVILIAVLLDRLRRRGGT